MTAQRKSVDSRILDALSSHPGWLPSVLARLSGYPDGDACWLWSGYSHPRGYGRVMLPRIGGAQAGAFVHRVVWLALRGSIPEGLVLDHDGPLGCGDKACANPAHIQPVTTYHNTVITGRGFAADAARRAHCPQGHPYEEWNLARHASANGVRRCLTCQRENSARRNALFRAAAQLLGMSKGHYLATYGSAESTARQLIDAEPRGIPRWPEVARRRPAGKRSNGTTIREDAPRAGGVAVPTRYDEMVRSMATGDPKSALVFWRSKQWSNAERARMRRLLLSAAEVAREATATPERTDES